MFDDVSFRYGPNLAGVFDLSFVVAAGKTVAFVGPSGSGKSTTARLACRLYDVAGGSVRRARDQRGDGAARDGRLYGSSSSASMLTRGTDSEGTPRPGAASRPLRPLSFSLPPLDGGRFTTRD